MPETTSNHGRVIALAGLGLALIGGGLWLAFLSNPKRFSINVADDRNIASFAISGFVVTLVGIVLFLAAVRYTTRSMPAQLRSKVNTGVALGFVLQLAGLLAALPIEVSGALIVAGALAFAWGLGYYALGKGYRQSVGLLGLGSVAGLMVLMLLPPRNKT